MISNGRKTLIQLQEDVIGMRSFLKYALFVTYLKIFYKFRLEQKMKIYDCMHETSNLLTMLIE